MVYGILGMATFFWLAGYLYHKEEEPRHLIPSSKPLKLLFVIPRSDGKMSSRGIAQQISAWVFLLWGIFVYILSEDQEVRNLLSVGCIFFLFINQFIWVFFLAPRLFRK